jgi:transcriptional regulator with XRE-family HTH domain
MTNTSVTSAPTPASVRATTRWIGERLRSVREQNQLTLVDVERLSRGDFAPSTIGAYERGDRTISIRRLDRLAEFYGVPVSQLLPRNEAAIMRRQSPIDGVITIELERLRTLDGAPFDALRRFIDLIREQRNDPTSTVISLRGTDAMVVAAMLDVPVDEVIARLRALDIAR